MASRFLVFSFFRGCFGQVLFSPFFDYGFQNGAKDSKRCKGVHRVDLGESVPTHILLQNLASTQPLTSPVKFARSPRTDPPGQERKGGPRREEPGEEVAHDCAGARPLRDAEPRVRSAQF